MKINFCSNNMFICFAVRVTFKNVSLVEVSAFFCLNFNSRFSNWLSTKKTKRENNIIYIIQYFLLKCLSTLLNVKSFKTHLL